MNARQNLLIVLAVIVLAVVPLWIVDAPEPDAQGNAPEIFLGADDKAKSAIGEIAPDYAPWFEPLFEPPSGEIASLLFALQAAIGAGFLGYYVGAARAREKLRRELGLAEGAVAPARAATGDARAC